MNKLLVLLLIGILLLGVLISGLESPGHNSLQDKFAKGIAAYRSGQYQRAISYLKDVYKDHPLYSYGRVLLAKSYFARNHYRKGLASLGKKPVDRNLVGVLVSGYTLRWYDQLGLKGPHWAYFQEIQNILETVRSLGYQPVTISDQDLEDAYKSQDQLDRKLFVDFSQIKTLILPNTRRMSKVQCENVRKFVNRGGTVLAIMQASFRDQNDQKVREGSYQLQDLMKVTYHSFAWKPPSHSYIRKAKDHPIWEGVGEWVKTHRNWAMVNKVKEGGKVLGSWYNQDKQTPSHTKNLNSALVEGKRTIYIGEQLFNPPNYKDPQVKLLLKNVLDYLYRMEETRKAWLLSYEFDLYRARGLYHINRLKEARQAADSAWKQSVSDKEKKTALRLLVDISVKRKNYSKAVDHFFKLLESFNLRFSGYQRRDLFQELKGYLDKLDLSKQENLHRIFKYARLISRYGDWKEGKKLFSKYLDKWPPDLYLKGLFHLGYLDAFRLDENKEAQRIFKKILTHNPQPNLKIKTKYYQAYHLKRWDKIGKAGGLFQELMDQHPQSYYGCLAAQNLAEAYFIKKDLAGAQQFLKDIQPSFEDSGCWDDLLWKAFFLAYFRKSFPLAHRYLKELEELNNSTTPKVAFWQYKLAQRKGNLSSQDLTEWVKILREHPFNYYSLIAQKRDYIKVLKNAYIRKEVTPEGIFKKLLPESQEKPEVSLRLKEANLLQAHGLTPPAQRRLTRLTAHLPHHKVLTLRFLWEKEQGEYRDALHLADRILELNREEEKLPSLTVLQGLWPRQYREAVKEASLEFELEEEIIYSVIREESGFHPMAFSTSQAHGLMQIMPATAKGIAADLKLSKFGLEDLFDPATNIRMGTYYLAQKVNQFKSLRLGIAGYQAGPGNVTKWKQDFKVTDLDLFVELIPFRSTRGYVKRVYRNYLLYRHLYP